MSMENYEFSHVPENHSQPGIFEIIKEGTLRKMGKLSKEAIIQKTLKNSKYVKDCQIPMPDYDPSVEDPMPSLPELPTHYPSDSATTSTGGTAVCPLLHCRLGCICNSLKCQDMYEEHYEKHCRDTGNPDCMFGCVCENGPGPKYVGNNGSESKWIISKPYKYKRPRVRDDEDCGFVPLHLREQPKDGGRPKRRAQPPTRYRPDLSKQERISENGTNGVSRQSSRPRRRLCDDDENDDSTDESETRSVKSSSKTTNKDSKLNITSALEQFENQLDAVQRRRWEKLEANRMAQARGSSSPDQPQAKRVHKSATASLDVSESDSGASGDQTDTSIKSKRGRAKAGTRNGFKSQTAKMSSSHSKTVARKVSAKVISKEKLKPKLERVREPSKRERKPRQWDLDLIAVPRPKRPYNKKKIIPNGHTSNSKYSVRALPESSQKSKPKSKAIPMRDRLLAIGTPLHVIKIQPPSRTCQGMHAVLRNTSGIITFVSWDEDSNAYPYMQEMKFRFTTSNPVTGSDFDKSCDIILLPFVHTEDAAWFFYSLKKDYLSWNLILLPEIHAILSSEALCAKINEIKPATKYISKLLNVADLNVNSSAESKGYHLYLYVGQEGDVFLCGTPPTVFFDKNKTVQFEHAVCRGQSKRAKAQPKKSTIKMTKVKSEALAPIPNDDNINNDSVVLNVKTEATENPKSVQQKIDGDGSDVHMNGSGPFSSDTNPASTLPVEIIDIA